MSHCVCSLHTLFLEEVALYGPMYGSKQQDHRREPPFSCGLLLAEWQAAI